MHSSGDSQAITAIEEEWILDEELREELSIITYED